MSRMTIVLNGLNCAGCAEKIKETAVNIDGGDSVDLNFVSKKLF